MALIIEDGTGKVDSNTYVLDTTFNTWLTDRGLTLSGLLTVDNLLLQASDYLETLSYKGFKFTQAQAMQHPRGDLYIDGYLFPSDEIAKQLIDAQMQVSYSIDQGVNPMATIGQAIKMEKVDVIEVEYQDGTISQSTITAVNKTLSKLLLNSGGSFTAGLSV